MCLVLTSLPAAYGGVSATVFSSDLTSGPSLENVKATWDTDMVLGAHKTKLSLMYDLKAKKDFIKEAKLAGAFADVKYTLTHAIGKGLTGLTLTSKQAGHTLKMVGDTAHALTQVSAKGSYNVSDYELDYEPTYFIKGRKSKLTLSTVLGGGVSATGSLVATNAGKVSTDFLLGYECSLSEGRELSAKMSPAKQAAVVEVTDTATEPGATWVAKLDLVTGGRPEISMRRSMKF